MGQNTRIRLNEVTLMRTILALLIVFMHSFTCYNGSWKEPVGYIDIAMYKWLARLSFAFTLEAFTFISGYLYAFQHIMLKRPRSGRILVVNKLKRLILPSIIFSVIYFILFYDFKGLGDAFYSIINGCGHLWYLPMLFWCFMGGWLLEQISIGDGWKMAFLVSLNLLSIIPLPLRLGNAASYMVYFYGGYLFYKYSERINKEFTINRIVWIWVVFFILFALLRPVCDKLETNDSLPTIQKLFFYVGNNLCQFVYAWWGLIAFFGTAVYYAQKHKLSLTTHKISVCCFGIYLFQQFVLQLLYYKTPFPSIVGPYWLPWCGFVGAAIVSYMISTLLLKTRVGRYLIG